MERVWNYEVSEEVGKRLAPLFEGLPPESVSAAIEGLMDDYAMAMFGTDVMRFLREVKMPSKGKSVCVQTLAKGRALLVSSYGFNVKTDTQCKCGRAFIVLDEKNVDDFKLDAD